MGPSQESTTESDSSPAIKPINWANVALRFAKTPNPSQQYQHLTSAEPVLLFKSGHTSGRRADGWEKEFSMAGDRLEVPQNGDDAGSERNAMRPLHLHFL